MTDEERSPNSSPDSIPSTTFARGLLFPIYIRCLCLLPLPIDCFKVIAEICFYNTIMIAMYYKKSSLDGFLLFLIWEEARLNSCRFPALPYGSGSSMEELGIKARGWGFESP